MRLILPAVYSHLLSSVEILLEYEIREELNEEMNGTLLKRVVEDRNAYM